MARGNTATAGQTRTAKNGYHYTKVEGRGWVLTHWLTMEKKLGREIDPAQEQVRFVSKAAKRAPYDVSGLILVRKKTSSQRRRLAVVEDRIRELTAERDQLRKELGE